MMTRKLALLFVLLACGCGGSSTDVNPAPVDTGVKADAADATDGEVAADSTPSEAGDAPAETATDASSEASSDSPSDAPAEAPDGD